MASKPFSKLPIYQNTKEEAGQFHSPKGAMDSISFVSVKCYS